jgi:hypothetical protein
MTLPITARNHLIDISAALHSKKPDLVEELLSTAPKEALNRVYERMRQKMDKPAIDKDGETAFRNPSLQQKAIKAVEKVILKDVPEEPAAEKPAKPEDALEVKMTAFWDTGFDPRFDEGGNFLLAPEKRTMRKVIIEIVAYCLFVFKAYCSPWSEERQLRKAILLGASLEKVWSSYYVRALVNDFNDPCSNWIRLAEYDFLENTGDIFRKLNPSFPLQLRPFPREVITPIHRMNKPQDPRQGIEKMKPGLENEDLVRIGFYRLSKDFYILNSSNKEKSSFDLFEYNYVPHYLFIHATRESANRLKLACRELRLQIAQTSTDFKCAFSFASCQEKLRPIFEEFNQAWQAYVNSHELLRENQEVWSHSDYRNEEYEALRAETKLSPEKADAHCKIADRPSAQAFKKCQEDLASAYIQHHSLSKTGCILKARDGAFSTLQVKI